jgi:predicted MPP superfamily phosphohydrolase
VRSKGVTPLEVMGKYVLFGLLILLSLLLDLYIYQGVKVLTAHLKPATRESIHWAYWGITSFFVVPFLVGILFFGLGVQNVFFRRFLLPCFFINIITKLFPAFFLLVDDAFRALRWTFRQAAPVLVSSPPVSMGISRSTFLTKVAVVTAAVPALTMSYGIISGAHDYRVRRVKVKLPHLPSAFHGLRIGQLSDIHSGSFFNKTAVKRGVEMLLREKPDIIFFTGDLVNNTADELNDYFDVFNKVKAPLGVYATLGNHDYGDYIRWESSSAKQKNHQAMRAAHQQLGWHLLMNEHKIITQGSDQLAVIGVENWGARGFSKYGRLDQAYCGAEDVPVKLLLSHDPSHWDAQIRPHYPDIDITFSGHTHGGQFGIEVGPLKWSPVQYLYKQWAGLYREGTQYLYVNRGYGYIGYPGRIGILPEITMMELERAPS